MIWYLMYDVVLWSPATCDGACVPVYRMANETMASYGRLPERVAAFVDRILANSKRFKVQGFRNMIYGKQVLSVV